MADFDSSLPVRTQQNGDVVTFLADSTTPSQLAKVDAFGSQQSVIRDASGNAIDSQLISSTYWLQVVMPGNGPAQPGTASSFSVLAGGIYNATPPVLTDGQQASLQLDSAGRLLVDANINFSSDTNYGTVGSNTLRTASQIGNATGAADFNAGATGAQTLRVEANQGAPAASANAWPVKLTDGTDTVDVNPDGSLNIVGTVLVSNLPTTLDTNYGVVGASTLRTASQIGNATGAADFNSGATGAQTLRVEANQGAPALVANAWPTKVTDGVDTMAVNTDGSINVVIADATPGTPINDFKSAGAIAAGASDNHDYVVTATKTFYLNQIESAGSGKAKMQIQVETGVATNVFNTRFVQFNSTAETNMEVHLDNPIAVAAGVRVRVIMTNKDLASQDLYSTISGYELP